MKNEDLSLESMPALETIHKIIRLQFKLLDPGIFSSPVPLSCDLTFSLTVAILVTKSKS